MKHPELDSAAAYALGALDDAERAAFEAHLHDCDECGRALAGYREVAGLIAHAAPAAAPADAAALRARILRDASSVRPLRPGAPPRVRSGRLSWIAAAACLAIAAASTLAYVRQRAAAARLDAEVAALQGAIADRDLTIAARDSLLAAFLGPEVHVVSLTAAEASPVARVFWNHTRNQFIVTAFALPPAPPGRTYQLWAIAEGRSPVSMGTFETEDDGRAFVILPVDAAVADAGFIDYCGVTLEPDGGSPQPTESPRLLGAWRHVD
jgi:anti-sigma-K factor RskA